MLYIIEYTTFIRLKSFKFNIHVFNVIKISIVIYGSSKEMFQIFKLLNR